MPHECANEDEKNPPRIGVGVIVVKNGKVLLGKRRNSHGDGTWSFPGGHLRFGEEVEECARREVQEETGLEISNLRRGPYTNDMFEQERRHYVTIFVIAQCAGGALDNREPEKCERWDWFEWRALPQPLFLPIRNLLRQNVSLASLFEPSS